MRRHRIVNWIKAQRNAWLCKHPGVLQGQVTLFPYLPLPWISASSTFQPCQGKLHMQRTPLQSEQFPGLALLPINRGQTSFCQPYLRSIRTFNQLPRRATQLFHHVFGLLSQKNLHIYRGILHSVRIVHWCRINGEGLSQVMVWSTAYKTAANGGNASSHWCSVVSNSVLDRSRNNVDGYHLSIHSIHWT